ncbi:hypothetical protein ACNOYE_23480 [Nannocystaceae bacterium ST9]
MSDERFSRAFEGDLVALKDHPEWFTGHRTLALARVWLPASLDQGRRWWERRAPSGDPAPIFWLDAARAEAEAKSIGAALLLGYPFAWPDLDVLHVARARAAEVRAEVFAAGHAAFCTDALELCIRADEIAIYLDVEDVEVREVE